MLRAALLPLPLGLLIACSAPTPPDTGSQPAATTQATAAIADPAQPTGLSIDASHLVNNHWLLTSAATAGNQPIDVLFPNEETPLQLDFNDGRLSISGGCNRHSGSYQIQGETLSVGSLASTRRACAAPLMDADRAIAAQLAAPLQIKAIDSGQLLLVSASGDTLSWRGEPTAETRYGGTAQTVFWEVAAQTVPCPQQATQQCLQVRPVHYDDKGIKQGEPGPFSAFAGTIEGYEHQPGTRHILRLKQFTLPAADARGNTTAQVLDMVVESDNG